MMTPDDPSWFSHIRAALVVKDEAAVNWQQSADVVVVGVGGAGVCAAIEAADCGASVIAIDRFDGGGATAISGGVVYLGGGTDQQRDTGVDDSPAEMFRYLQMEAEGVVSDATLRRFCEESPAMQKWLNTNGVEFKASLCPVKTSYPPSDYYLYYSGNESVPSFAAKAKPAQRGHRAYSKQGGGFAGPAFFDPLKRSAIAKGVTFLGHSRVTRLVIQEDGTVLGLEIRHLPANHPDTIKHSRYAAISARVRLFLPALARHLASEMMRLEESSSATVQLIRANKGVIITAGGFIQNRKMVSHYAPQYRKGMALGASACDGSGIRLGQTAGASVELMEKVSAWRFINPPIAWAKGILVNTRGERFCNEQLYGARIGHHMVEENDGRAFVIINRELARKAWKQVTSRETWYFQALPVFLNIFLGCKRANTLGELARKCGIPADALEKSVANYNRAVRGEIPDPFGKAKDFHCSLEKGPYHALDVSLASKIFPCATITFGGLVVNEETGQVLHESGKPIPGLYAGGRSAVGIPSRFYVSGLSIADCIFSGRRAARHCATVTSN